MFYSSAPSSSQAYDDLLNLLRLVGDPHGRAKFVEDLRNEDARRRMELAADIARLRSEVEDEAARRAKASDDRDRELDDREAKLRAREAELERKLAQLKSLIS